MGSGRDKRKKAAKRVGKDGSGPSGDAKTSAKTDKNAAKLERRTAKAAADDDIDAGRIRRRLDGALHLRTPVRRRCILQRVVHNTHALLETHHVL